MNEFVVQVGKVSFLTDSNKQFKSMQFALSARGVHAAQSMIEHHIMQEGGININVEAYFTLMDSIP